MPGIVCSAPSAVEAMVPRTHASSRRDSRVDWRERSDAGGGSFKIERVSCAASQPVSQLRATATIVSAGDHENLGSCIFTNDTFFDIN